LIVIARLVRATHMWTAPGSQGEAEV
jgi:hypothetical protein